MGFGRFGDVARWAVPPPANVATSFSASFKIKMLPLLFTLITINVLFASLIATGCGKRESNNGAQPGTLNRGNITAETTVDLSFSQIQHENQSFSQPVRADIYHEAAESFAYPASSRCKNHDDVWRILALYLDYIRAVNPVEFENFRMMDAALAVLHDFNFYIRASDLSNDTIALSVVYFLVDYHKIKVNLGSEQTPWFAVLSRTAKIEDLQKMRVVIESELVGFKSEETAMSV